MSSNHQYKRSIVLPIFGEVPLNLREIYSGLKGKDGPLWAQFFKYIVCGLISVAIFISVLFVFTSGRHSFWREFGIFMLISSLSFGGGEFGKTWMVNSGFANWVASSAFAISSGAVNFVARKFVVFSR